MVEPRIVPREAHSLSRRDVDPDALKVLYRLKDAHYIAYLVGGGVRDLLLGRRPKDFDIGTSAHPAQVKKLFRNCWIIGRRFRLAHVKFGQKVIEVATFRRLVPPGDEASPTSGDEQAASPGSELQASAALDANRQPAGHDRQALGEQAAAEPDASVLHRDNTFGTPEEDAFRRDFTINALFYDIATFSVIDYVGGLDDLQSRVVRCIGDPDVRFREDPVRMLRAVALAARLDFTIDQPVVDAIARLRHELAKSSPARMLEEYYKILRSGCAEKTFRALSQAGLLEPVSRELHDGAGDALWHSLAALDRYRAQFESTPATMSNTMLLGSLLEPLGLSPAQGRPPQQAAREGRRKRPPIGSKLGEMPLARRDVERLRHVLGLQRRLRDTAATVRAQRALTHRSAFRDGLTWLEIHGHNPGLVEHWISVLAERGADEPVQPVDSDSPANQPSARRRRRRRRRRRPTPAPQS